MNTSPASTPVILHQPRVPAIFRGSPGEDPEEWLDQFERVATFNRWEDGIKLRYVFFSMDGPGKTWYEKKETTLTAWPLFKSEVLKTFASILRKERAQILLESRVEQPNETLNMYVEEMKRLFRRADPNMTEEKKVGFLMRGVMEPLSAGLVRNPPKTVAEFAQEASTIGRTLDARNRQFDRPPQDCLVCPGAATSTDDLREIVREGVREELRHLLVSPPQPQAVTVMDVVREV